MPDPRARIIAIANQKGGVGKSTTAVSLGASLAELGKRVLVVDLDPQGNASTGLGIRHEAREITVYDVLAAEAPIEGAIVQTPVENLFAIPSTIDLAGAEIELVSQFSRELRLRKALEPLKHGAFDFILLDCPPSLGLLTVNALAAAEELIVPIQCEYYALEGLGQLLRNVSLVQQNVNTGLRLTGIVMTMYDPRTKLSEQVVAEVRRYFGDRVYDTIIPRTVRLSEAPGFGQPITIYDPKSRGAQCYRDLAREVADKLPSDEGLPIIDDLPSIIVPPVEPEPARAPRPLIAENEPAGSVEGDGLERTSGARGPLPPGEVEGVISPEPGESHPSAGEDTQDAVQVEAGSDLSAEPTGKSTVRDPAFEGEPEAPVSSGEIDPATAGPTNGEAAGDVQASVSLLPVSDPAAASMDSESGVDLDAPGEPGQRRSVSEVSINPGTVPAPRLEVGQVIVIDEEKALESERPMPEPDQEDAEDSPRKRWGLFRRGGDR